MFAYEYQVNIVLIGDRTKNAEAIRALAPLEDSKDINILLHFPLGIDPTLKQKQEFARRE